MFVTHHKPKNLRIKIAVFAAVVCIFIAPPVVCSQTPTSEASARCWSRGDCMKKTENCAACFEEQTIACGSSRGFCYAKPVPAELEIALPGLSEPVRDPAQYISKLYEWGISVTGILAGIMIMIGGLLYLTAGGSPERVSNAKSYISNALIGLVLAMTSSLLLQTVNPALLSLKFPKVPLVAPAIAFNIFCEDLETAGTKVNPAEPGKTGCGDLGIPEGTEENEQVPTNCTYQKCQNPEEACLPCTSPDLLDCPKTANCFPCAGVRLDAALAAIVDPQPGTPSDFQTPRRNYGSLTCDKLKPIAQHPYVNQCEFLDIPSFVGGGSPWDSFKAACGDFGTGALYASLGTGGLSAGVAKFAKVGPEAAGFVTKVSRAEVITNKLAGAGLVAGEITSAVGGVIGSETVTDIGNTASFAATCGGGVLIAMSNPIALIAGGTYAAVKEWLKVGEIAMHPEKFFGVNGSCALVAINCSQINSCEDYEKIQFKASGTKNWQEVLTEMALEPEAFLSSAQNIRSYCDLDPCQLPLKCISAMQNGHYWTHGERGRFEIIATNPAAASTGHVDKEDFKCIPLEMSAINNPDGSGRWLLSQDGIEAGMIYPIVRPFQPGTQQKGQLCLEDADCVSGSCQDGGVLYKNVYKLDRNSFKTTKEGTPEEITYKRCQ